MAVAQGVSANLIRIKENTYALWNVLAILKEWEAKMIRLATILYSLIATTLAGTAVVVVLTAGYGTLVPIVAAAAVGATLALPVSYLIAREVYQS